MFKKILISIVALTFCFMLSAQSSCNVSPSRTSCKELYLTDGITTSGVYKIDPDGREGPSAPFDVYCDMTANNAGWTLIISQQNLISLPDYYSITPMPDNDGVREFYLQNDLKLYADEIRVTNHSNQTNIFRSADFTGPLVTNNPNFVDASDSNVMGLIAGNNYPVVTHFQVGQSCSSADCHNNASSSTSYCQALAQVWDWHTNDVSVNVNNHAHFGCKSQIESTWSLRGMWLYIR